MDPTKLTTIISLLVALGIASERLAALQLLAVGVGITTAWFASPVVSDFIPNDFTGKLALGLLAAPVQDSGIQF